jgi:hypothetical protein
VKEHFETISRLLDLAGTCQEGLEYTKAALSQGKADSSVSVLVDALEAFSMMEANLQPLLPGLPGNRISELTDKLRQAFDLVVTVHEEGRAGKAQEYMQFVLIPGYQLWREELEK